MNDATIFMILYGLLAVVLVLVVYVLIEAIRILIRARRLMDRVDLITDIRMWFSMLRKLPRCRSKKD